MYKMPKQSQKKSQTQSKNGGRRRKSTMRKLRRMKKSRKVMRGGNPLEYSDLKKKLETNGQQMAALLKLYNVDSFDNFKRKYQDGIPSEQISIPGLISDIKRNNGSAELSNFIQEMVVV